MISEERFWTLLVESNPIPDASRDGSDLIDGTAYLATLEERSSIVKNTDLEVVERQSAAQKGQTRFRPGTKWLAVAAAVAVVGVAVLVATRASEDTPPASGETIGIALAFFEARSNHDGDAMTSLFAPDAKLQDELIEDPANYHALAGLEQAIGMQYFLEECLDSEPAPDGSVRVFCTFEFESDWNRALDRGSTPTNSIRFVIADGKITDLAHNLNWGQLTQIQQVFYAWVETNHLRDLPLMFRQEELRRPLLTPEAIDLFESHTAEYVAAMTGS